MGTRFWFIEVPRSAEGLYGSEPEFRMPGFRMPGGSAALGFRVSRESVMKICTAMLFITKKTGNSPNCPPQGTGLAERVPQ